MGYVVAVKPRRVSVTQGGQTVTESGRKLPSGNWGCAEAGGVVYMYYCLCRRVVLLVLTLCTWEVGGGLTTVCGFGFVSCWEIYALVCISGSDGGQRVMVFAPPTVRSPGAGRRSQEF